MSTLLWRANRNKRTVELESLWNATGFRVSLEDEDVGQILRGIFERSTLKDLYEVLKEEFEDKETPKTSGFSDELVAGSFYLLHPFTRDVFDEFKEYWHTVVTEEKRNWFLDKIRKEFEE